MVNCLASHASALQHHLCGCPFSFPPHYALISVTTLAVAGSFRAVFDVSRRSTFERIPNWLDEVKICAREDKYGEGRAGATLCGLR